MTSGKTLFFKLVKQKNATLSDGLGCSGGAEIGIEVAALLA
jgi:hypothetical protein